LLLAGLSIKQGWVKYRIVELKIEAGRTKIWGWLAYLACRRLAESAMPGQDGAAWGEVDEMMKTRKRTTGCAAQNELIGG